MLANQHGGIKAAERYHIYRLYFCFVFFVQVVHHTRGYLPLASCALYLHPPRELSYWQCIGSCWQAQPGSRLVEESYFCPLCQDRAAGIDLLAVALQVVKFSDDEFFDAQLRQQFAENAEKVALQNRALWPGSKSEVGVILPLQFLRCASDVQRNIVVNPLYHGISLPKPCGSTQPVCIETLGCSRLCELFFARLTTHLFLYWFLIRPPPRSVGASKHL